MVVAQRARQGAGGALLLVALLFSASDAALLRSSKRTANVTAAVEKSKNSSSSSVSPSLPVSSAAGWSRFAQDPKFRWPEAKPTLFSEKDVALFPNMDLSHGKPGERAPLVTKVIRGLAAESEVVEILEVGVWLGGTVAEWTATSPKVRVAAMDPWELSHYEDPNAAVCRGHCSDRLAQIFKQNRDEAFFTAAETRLWPLKEQVVLVRGKAPQAFNEVAEAGLSPKLLFLDGGKAKSKTFEWNYNFLTGVLESAHQRWPNAWIAGDDWHWAANKGGARNGKGFIETAVLDFVQKRPELGCRMQGHYTYVVGPAHEVDRFSTEHCI